jgi:hypothetical protein
LSFPCHPEFISGSSSPSLLFPPASGREGYYTVYISQYFFLALDGRGFEVRVNNNYSPLLVKFVFVLSLPLSF